MAANAELRRLSSPVFMACPNSMNGHLAGIRAARKFRAAKTSAAGISLVKQVSSARAKIANAVAHPWHTSGLTITAFKINAKFRIIVGIIAIAGQRLTNVVSSRHRAANDLGRQEGYQAANGARCRSGQKPHGPKCDRLFMRKNKRREEENRIRFHAHPDRSN
jgi:hypothetical protein